MVNLDWSTYLAKKWVIISIWQDTLLEEKKEETSQSRYNCGRGRPVATEREIRGNMGRWVSIENDWCSGANVLGSPLACTTTIVQVSRSYICHTPTHYPCRQLIILVDTWMQLFFPIVQNVSWKGSDDEKFGLNFSMNTPYMRVTALQVQTKYTDRVTQVCAATHTRKLILKSIVRKLILKSIVRSVVTQGAHTVCAATSYWATSYWKDKNSSVSW